MKILVILCFLILSMITTNVFGQDIELPKVEAKLDMGLSQALETRSASRSFNDKKIQIEDIGRLLWAGNGIVQEKPGKTVHGFDAVSGASSTNKHSVQWGWGNPYLKLYVMLESGAYEYLPEKHQLEFISDKNIIKSIGSNASNPQAIIVIAADYGKMPRGERATTINVSFMTAGSTAQNIHLFATVNNIKMMTEVSFNKTEIQKGLNLPDTVKPLTILSFGYSD